MPIDSPYEDIIRAKFYLRSWRGVHFGHIQPIIRLGRGIVPSQCVILAIGTAVADHFFIYLYKRSIRSFSLLRPKYLQFNYGESTDTALPAIKRPELNLPHNNRFNFLNTQNLSRFLIWDAKLNFVPYMNFPNSSWLWKYWLNYLKCQQGSTCSFHHSSSAWTNAFSSEWSVQSVFLRHPLFHLPQLDLNK